LAFEEFGDGGIAGKGLELEDRLDGHRLGCAGGDVL
jgi:hypothetical protein